MTDCRQTGGANKQSSGCQLTQGQLKRPQHEADSPESRKWETDIHSVIVRDKLVFSSTCRVVTMLTSEV